MRTNKLNNKLNKTYLTDILSRHNLSQLDFGDRNMQLYSPHEFEEVKSFVFLFVHQAKKSTKYIYYLSFICKNITLKFKKLL